MRNRLIAIIERAYELGMQAQVGNIDSVLAEEVTGECGELIALINNNHGVFGDDECIDDQLVGIAEFINELEA